MDREDSPAAKPKPKVPVRPAVQEEKEKKKEDVKPEAPKKDVEKEKVEAKDTEKSKEEVEGGEKEKEGVEEPAEEGSRWRKLYNKTAFTFQSSKDSAAAAAQAKKEAAAQKLKATQESIKASKDAATAAGEFLFKYKAFDILNPTCEPVFCYFRISLILTNV